MTSTTLPRNTFLPKLRTDSLPSGAITVQDKVIIDDTNCTWNYKKLENITFTNTFEVSSINIKSGLVFINCNFNKGIKFIGIESDLKISENNPFNQSVYFSKCNGTFMVFNKCPNILRGVLIENESSFDSIHFQSSHLSEIKIKNSKINKLLEVSNVKSNEIRLDKNTLKKNFRVVSFEGDISLISNTFDDWAKFWNVSFNRSFALNKNIFNGEFEIEASRIKGFYIHEDTFNKNFRLENRDTSGENNNAFCDEIYISQAKFLEGAEFNGLSKEINKITLRLSPSFEGILNFEGWKVDKLHVSGINQNLKLLFKRMVFRCVIFNNFTNYSDLSFDKCNAIENSPLNLSNTNFGSARLNEMNLASFSQIYIDNVSFDNIKASNVKWFENNQIEIGSNSTEEEKQRGIREISRQLKHALSGSGNQIDSLMFRAREMEAYRNELISTGKNYSWKDRLIMTVNMTNNYGLSWWKPTWLISLITLVYYIFILPLFSDLITYGFPSSLEDGAIILSEFWNNFEVFWQLFNPARKFTNTYGQIDSGWLQFLDLVHRLILGVFIFQIIRGFRRFNIK